MGLLSILVANVIAAVVLVVFLIPGVLTTTAGRPYDVSSEAVGDQAEHNRAMRDGNRVLEESIEGIECLPDGTLGERTERTDTPQRDGTGDGLPDSGDVADRLSREEAATGAVQVSLAWNGRSDLDLVVICPDGSQINFSTDTACGGVHDVDMNIGGADERPVENIVWPTGAAPPGLYKVWINFFDPRGTGLASVPYVVDIKIGEQTRRLTGEVACCRTPVEVGTFVIGERDPALADEGTRQGTVDGNDGPARDDGEAGPERQPDAAPLPVDPKDAVVEEGGGEVPLVDAIEQGVVLVVVVGTGEDGGGIGSGFLIDPTHVVTNRHVIDDAAEVYVVSRRLGRVIPAQIVAKTTDTGQPKQLDFAVLELGEAPAELKPLKIAPNPNRLQQVISAGFPGFVVGDDAGFRRLLDGDLAAAPEMVTTDGIVTRPAQAGEPAPYIMHSADIAQGNSGGPLVDACGRVVGVNTLVRLQDEQSYRTSWALAADALLTFLDSHDIRAQRADRPCDPRSASRDEAPDPVAPAPAPATPPPAPPPAPVAPAPPPASVVPPPPPVPVPGG